MVVEKIRGLFGRFIIIVLTFVITYTINLYFIFTNQSPEGLMPLFITIIAFILAYIIKYLGGK